MDKYQKAVDEWAQTLAKPYWSPLSQMAHLSEEVGEVARLLNHIYGDKPKKPTEAKQELGGELADVLFVLVCMANAEGINLDKEFEKVLVKSRVRDANRFKKKKS